ncbi:hypothetical protein IWQ56_000018 [Coemansia nantahalensis]|nr:hypothetical protein IWQ56_000018 [Coemansia nantahalensis]
MSDGFKVPALPGRARAQNSDGFPALSYTAPPTAGAPQYAYTLEVVKDGRIVEEHEVPRDSTFRTFGRLPVCDYPMEHGSISRYHAVLQFYADGAMAVVDLGSSHGTLVNKERIPPRAPHAVSVGDQIAFGASSRLWIIGCTDPAYVERRADEEPHGTAVSGTSRKEASRERDPIVRLRKFLDKCEYAYQPEGIADGAQAAAGIRIELPYADSEGRTLYGTGFGAEPAEAERLACVDALRQLDAHGYLDIHRRKRPAAGAAEVESDGESNDGYYDTTAPGAYDQARLEPDAVETRESLTRKLALADAEIAQAEQVLHEASADAKDTRDGDDDELDAYMNALAHSDQLQRAQKLAGQLERLRRQKSRLESILEVIAPHRDVAEPAAEPAPTPARQGPPVAPQAPPASLQEPAPAPKEKRRRVQGPVQEAPESVRPSSLARAQAGDGGSDASWQPPAGQTGDGRTALNDRLGY